MAIGTEAPKALSGGTWYDNTSSGMSFYSLQLTQTSSSYTFTNLTGELIIMGYGTGANESYYYLAASGMYHLR
jgi:hypothetical protein